MMFIVPGGFEPSSPAPKARRIDHYPTGLLWVLQYRYETTYSFLEDLG